MVDEDCGLTRMITPMNPKTNPKNCLRVTSSLNQINAMIIVLNAVVAFRIAKILISGRIMMVKNDQ